MKDKSRKNKILLVGYRATGKSTLAAELAKRWGLEWVDSDDVVEKVDGRSIAKIFKESGEPYFRDLEAKVIADLLDSDGPLVIATGGGAPMRPETRRAMKERGVVVWLTASPEEIAKRMSGDATTGARRPSLTGASPIDEIVDVLTKREPLYRDAASFSVETDGKTIDELVEIVADQAPEFFF